MRERRDVDRLDSPLVSPIPPVSPGYPAGMFYSSETSTLSTSRHSMDYGISAIFPMPSAR
jgi:hypothetical protein